MGDNRKPTTVRARPAASRQWTTLAIVVAGVMTVAGIGCSVEKHYRLLSFFFDGVPPPRSADDKAAQRDVLGGLASAGMVSAHQAYTDRRCVECHGASSQFGFFTTGFAGLDAGVCLQCHSEVMTTPGRLHGPVAAMACLWCHDPHESKYPSLLVESSPDMCLACHRMRLQGIAETPGHEQPPADCLACHAAHGDAERYLLHLRQPEQAEP